eukprot:12833573-Alexandrium_andersonii.AAC.1
MRCCLRELYKQSPRYLSATASKSRLTREGRWYGLKSAPHSEWVASFRQSLLSHGGAHGSEADEQEVSV